MTQPPPTAHFYISCFCPLFFTFPTRPKLQCLALALTADVGDRWAAGEGEGAFWQQPRPTQRKGEGEVFSFLPVRKRRRRIADRGARIK